MGRPSDYTPELAAKICIRIAGGESLRGVCKDDSMPDRSTVLRWLFDNEKAEFRDQYARAREIQAESMADELLEIADDGTNDWMERQNANGQTFQAVDHDHIARSRLRVDTRKWVAAKLLPKKYGDKQQVEQSGALTISWQQPEKS